MHENLLIHIHKKPKWHKFDSLLLVFYYRSLKVTNIYVVGNNRLTEKEILDKTNLLTYPKLYQVNKNDIKNKLLENELINKVDISKSLSGKITIIIEEKTFINMLHLGRGIFGSDFGTTAFIMKNCLIY